VKEDKQLLKVSREYTATDVVVVVVVLVVVVVVVVLLVVKSLTS
jgi:hypothetical protein